MTYFYVPISTIVSGYNRP